MQATYRSRHFKLSPLRERLTRDKGRSRGIEISASHLYSETRNYKRKFSTHRPSFINTGASWRNCSLSHQLVMVSDIQPGKKFSHKDFSPKILYVHKLNVGVSYSYLIYSGSFIKKGDVGSTVLISIRTPFPCVAERCARNQYLTFFPIFFFFFPFP